MTNWTNVRYVVIDVEGNGQQPPDLVELAAVPIVAGIVGEPKSWLVRPGTPITPFARKIHGITNDAVATAPAFADIKDEVLGVLAGAALVGHNVHVDVAVLERKLGVWDRPEVFDTLKLARRLLPDVGGYKLGALVKAFKLAEGLPGDLMPHRATYDVLVTARLFVRLASPPNIHPLSLEELRADSPGGSDDETPTLF